jgi:hypothetical protein
MRCSPLAGPRLRVVKAVLSLAAALLAAGVAQAGGPYRILGSSDLDLALCKASGPKGVFTTTLWVMRDPTTSGPTQVALTGAPPGVVFSVDPTVLTYPGWVVGQQVTITLTLDAGVPVPDTVLTLTAGDAEGNSGSAALLLHGSCPRHNRDFIVRGSFFSTQKGTTFPVEGALVEIYRDVSWAPDQKVGATITGPDGSFEVQLWASRVDTYYAKLRLNDVAGVYLHDWWTPEIKDYNSFNRADNSSPVLDLGGTLITKNGGSGTPKSAIWQGGHWAFQEYIRTFSAPPPTGDYEIVNQNTVSTLTWTARSTTNWEENDQTFKFSNGHPTAKDDPKFDPYFSQFINYDVNFHEFGHALRHTVDGNQAHFLADSARWTYARGHSLCGSDPGYVDVEGFGFNEGWAEYWERVNFGDVHGECPGIDMTDMTLEGPVSLDLQALANALTACQGAGASKAETAMAQRRGMFAVLERGENIIHSEGEFRSNFAQQYPGCPVPPIGTAVSVAPLTSAVPYRSRPNLSGLLATRVKDQQAISARIAAQLATAERQAADAGVCAKAPCQEWIARIVRPRLLRGQLEYANLIGRAYAERLASERTSRSHSPDISAAALERDEARLAAFRREVMALTQKALSAAAFDLDKHAGGAPPGEAREAAADLRRTARRLQLAGPIDDELFTLLEPPPAASDDAVRPWRTKVRPPPPPRKPRGKPAGARPAPPRTGVD